MGAKAAAHDPALETAANVLGGKITCAAVAEAFGMTSVQPSEVL